MRHILARLTYANVMATAAVFIALGGASYAAINLPKNSVGARQLKKGAVTPAKLSAGAKSTIRGPAGAQGPKGDPGAPATALWAVVSAEGKVLHGTALSAVATGAGTYEVTFARNLSACATVVTSREVSTKVRAELSNHDPDTVNVLMELGSFNEFSLAVFC